MRVFVTGGAGFIGGAVIRRLLGGGHGVTAVVRGTGRPSPEDATVVSGDLSDAAVLAGQIARHDAVVHVAGSYRIGLRPSERPAMWDSNVGATERVIDAAAEARAGRIVHVSTVNAFGNTRGRVVDETYARDPADGFLSWYDETKYRAHEAALARIANGLPVLVAMAGGVYGPGTTRRPDGCSSRRTEDGFGSWPSARQARRWCTSRTWPPGSSASSSTDGSGRPT